MAAVFNELSTGFTITELTYVYPVMQSEWLNCIHPDHFTKYSWLKNDIK